MDTNIDPLQIKISDAQKKLPEATRRAIAAVPWKTVILSMKETKGYNFDQLADLETETELLLAGLLAPEDYPKELAARMKIPKFKADELVEEMNKLVFGKIREELIKITEGGEPKGPEVEMPVAPTIKLKPDEASVLHSAGIEIPGANLTTPELPAGQARLPDGQGMLAQKFAGTFQMPSKKTEYTVPNVSKPAEAKPKPAVDPYREPLE